VAVKTGLDVLLEQKAKILQGKRVGLIIHQASVTRHLTPALTALWTLPRLHITALFAPEHGLAGTLQDQIPVGKEDLASLPVFSLYGDQRSPTPEMLRRVDALVFDLQDVGVRYYTFIWTMVLGMQAAAAYKKEFIVLDRPNPIGNAVEGNVLDENYSSFVGLLPLPVRHGMTAGELARYFNARFDIHCDLKVVSLRGWDRKGWFEKTGLPWVLPSPNMPTVDTAAVYAGMCLVEGTNLSEGRGTTRPFEIVGAPFIDGEKLARELARRKLPGVVFRPCQFLPTFHKWANQVCGGVQLHVTDRKAFPSYLAGLEFLQAVRRLYPKHFQWRPPPYEYELVKLPIDILCGTDGVRLALERGEDLKKYSERWRAPLRAFARERAPFLLY